MDWIDKAIGEIIARQEHYTLVEKTRLVRDQLEEIQKQMEQAQIRLSNLNRKWLQVI